MKTKAKTPTEIKSRPIMFSAPMVLTILNTKPGVWPARPIDRKKPFKFQTRRVIKTQPELRGKLSLHEENAWHWECKKLDAGYCHTGQTAMARLMVKCCPYGKVGDRLWVKETWAESYNSVPGFYYRADLPIDPDEAFTADYSFGLMKWKSPRFMAKVASRILLEIKFIRAVRVQEISEADAKAEGTAIPSNTHPIQMHTEHRFQFHLRWDEINRKRGFPFADNPWVYAIDFMRIT
jgi:hypothetical protein